MPWVTRRSRSKKDRLRRAVRRWAYDHGDTLGPLWLVGALGAAALGVLYVLSII